MYRNSKGQVLGIADAEELSAWFLYHMPMEQRRQLMAEKPLLYARLYPEVKTEVITDRVEDALREQAEDNE